MRRNFTFLFTLVTMLLTSISAWADTAEKTVYTTTFQNWSDVSSKTTEQTVAVKTTDNQDLTFSLMETSCDNDGTNTKFTSECITSGYLMAAKTATPYIKTSALKSITTVTFVHCATGSNRGWGLKVKGDGDADWVTLSEAIANPAAGQEVTIAVNRTNVQLWFYNLNSSQNAYMTSLTIKGNVEVADRTFTDFKVDFRTDPYTVVTPETGLPEGVTIDAGTYHGNQHGTQKATITVPVDGPVKFTIGGCQYGNGATVSIDGGDAIAIDTKSAGCDNGFGTYTKFATYTYNVEQAATLTFNLGAYCPYFFAEKCDFIPSVTVTYYDTTGSKIGEEVVDGNSELKFSEEFTAKVTVPEGQAFRGWFNGKAATATKVKEGIALTEDTKLYAHATNIENAVVGTHFAWDLTKVYFYDEDHEAINMPGGLFHDATHGWTVAKTNSIKIAVGGKALVSIKNCKFSGTQTAVATNKAGEQISTCDLENNVTTDGSIWSFQYNGTEADTLTITYPSGAYVHGVEVYNVADFVEKDAAGYYEVAAGDGATLMMLLSNAQSGDKIFLPNGTYDFGETALTTIGVDNVSIIGESMEGTIIKNAPDKSNEGIGTTATLLNSSNNLYIQDLTIQNALDYYGTGSAGRAVCLQDKGANTICKNVKMLSYQDTYYSNKASNFYWEDCEIHGTVDYLCGDGDVVYNRCKFVNESRSASAKSGSDVLCAPYHSASCTWGYVFLDCSVESKCTDFTFARSWGGNSAAQFIRTKITDNSLNSSRWTTAGMNVAAYNFKEFGTMDANGNVTTPASNVVTFTHSSGNKTYETVLSADEAANYTVANIYGDWAPDVTAAQVTELPAEGVFLVDGAITTTLPTSGKVRVANGRGGFGPEIDAVPTAIASVKTSAETSDAPIYNVAGQRVNASAKGVLIQNGHKFVK